MSIIRLTTCNDLFEAHQLKTKLDEEEITCFLTNENFSSLFPNYSGVMGSGIHIMIEDSDFEKALKIIKPDTVGNIQKVIVCPNCNSKEISYSLGHNPLGKILVIILSLLVWVPFGNIKKAYVCKECGTRFKI